MSTQQMDMMQQNAYARMNLLRTGISMIKRLQPVNGALGSQLRIPLLRMGIMTGVMLQFTVPVNITVAATISPVAPWNLAQSVAYTDFSGTNRTKTNGFQLWAAQSMKQADAISVSPAMISGGAGVSPLLNSNTNIIRTPFAVAADTLSFSLWVPMAYDPASDLTGAVLTQTNVGEHYITVQLANALVSTDPWIAPYITGTMTNPGGVTVEAYQYYIQPQNMSADNLPIIDLSTVYGFEGGYQSNDGIASGQPKYINLPNNRSILSTLVNFENNSLFTLNETDIGLVTTIANSNTNFKEQNPRLIRETMRNIVNCDMPSGTYYLGSRAQPILTQLYANVQQKFDVITANAGVTQFISQFEVQYPSGSPLPGITG